MIGDSLRPAELGALNRVTKYNGAKDELFPVLIPAIGGVRGTYFEPFLGSGSVFIRMARMRMLGERAVLSDLNPDVINLHRAVRDDVEGLIMELESMQEAYASSPAMEEKERFYYDLRKEFNALTQPRTGTNAAAMFLGLLRLDVNGIIRYNQQGQFNISWSKRPTLNFFPSTTPIETFRAVGKLLREPGVSLWVEDFERVASRARPGDVVYCDPPYYASSSAQQYTIRKFTQEDQLRVKALADRLSAQGTRFIEDNNHDPFILDLYCRPPTTYVCASVSATEKIAMDPMLRGARSEVLITNRHGDGQWAASLG